jgi:HK97 gp10 family phage protein
MRGITATAIFRPRSEFGRFIETRVSPAVRMAVQESCDMIETRARELCPVDTGTLQASISTDLDESGKTLIGRVAPHTDYSAYVEYGTGIAGAASAGAGEGPYSSTWPGMVAQPYMRPAMDEAKPKIKDIFANDVGLAVK